MKFSVIICTYNRAKAVKKLLNSIFEQTVLPFEVLVIDASENEETHTVIEEVKTGKVRYYKVSDTDKGLTKQRNFGISKVAIDAEIVCFLDDDVVLDEDYFKNLINTYQLKPEAVGVGGYITNEVAWAKKKGDIKFDEFEYDGYVRKLGKRNVLRKRLGLLSDKPPGYMPEFSHGFSIGYLPPSNKVYQVDFFMGGVASYKKEILDSIKFSTYFEGYGLYEDMDYCLRILKEGNLYVNTSATLQHYHEANGRPNQYNYGKMVIENGWYVLKVYNRNPSLKNRCKWHTITWLLIVLRACNICTDKKRKEAFTETIGRIVGWFNLLLIKKGKANEKR